MHNIRSIFAGYSYGRQLVVYKLALQKEAYELLKIINTAIPLHKRQKFYADVQALKL